MKKIKWMGLLACILSASLALGCSTSTVSKEENASNPPKTEARLPLSVYGGAWDSGHLQGMTIDDARQYMYFSFTDYLVKTDMQGNVVKKTDKLSGHLGDLCYYNGKIYGSMERSVDDSHFHIAVFDEKTLDYTKVHLKEVHNDYWFDADGNGSIGAAHNDGDHYYGCSGIDGVAVGTVPGSPLNSEKKLMVAYGIYSDTTKANGAYKRADVDYNVILQYDLDSFSGDSLDPKNSDQTDPDHEAKYFIYTGNTTYGVQNLAYDKDTGDYWMGVYVGTKSTFPNYGVYCVDGKVAPVNNQRLKGVNYANDSKNYGSVLQLAKKGTLHQASGVYGWKNTGGNVSTGMVSLGNNLFYISDSGKKTEGGVSKQYGYAYLYECDRENPTTPFKKVGKQ